ncbi:hypothetical protein M8J77_003790 [Diaphorina citri]|nr:hypothetical protein M8J77_003790 [Diaphorina citri]
MGQDKTKKSCDRHRHNNEYVNSKVTMRMNQLNDWVRSLMNKSGRDVENSLHLIVIDNIYTQFTTTYITDLDNILCIV